jgi:hypothetical protein
MQAAEELQGVTICSPVNRVRARCRTCHEVLENAYQPVGEAWAEKHEREALDADPDRVHRVEISITYHEIGLTVDHEKYLHRWVTALKDDYRKYARRWDVFKCIGEVGGEEFDRANRPKFTRQSLTATEVA